MEIFLEENMFKRRLVRNLVSIVMFVKRMAGLIAGRMIKERDTFKEELTSDKDEVTDQFLDVMEDVITFLLAKQKKFMQQLNELHEKHIHHIDGQIKRCRKVQQETAESLRQLSVSSVIFQAIGTPRQFLEKKIFFESTEIAELLRMSFNMFVVE